MRGNSSAWTRAALLVGWAAVGFTSQGCQETTTSVGRSGPIEVGPRAGSYAVGEFVFHNECAEPVFDLSGARATVRSAVFELIPDTERTGTIQLTGTFLVADPTPGEPPIAIFEGPDGGVYSVSGDTLRLRFTSRTNNWVAVIPFTQFKGGVIAGGSANRCRSMLLRLERQL